MNDRKPQLPSDAGWPTPSPIVIDVCGVKPASVSVNVPVVAVVTPNAARPPAAIVPLNVSVTAMPPLSFGLLQAAASATTASHGARVRQEAGCHARNLMQA